MTDETTDTVPEAEPESNQVESESGFTEEDASSTSVEDEADIEDGVDEDSKSVHGDDEVESDAAKPKEEEKRPGMAKGILEYDLADMYPEVSVLVGKPRREWDFHDPEIIRAIWLDSKTNAITEWKIKYANLHKARKAQVEIPLNHTAQLRLEFQKQKEEQKRTEFKKMEQMMTNGKQTPHFNTVQMATTTTVEMRYKFTRNNPPVPSYYINHYDKHKKPPFKTKIGRPCKQDES